MIQVMQGWNKVAEDDRAMKSAFTAMKHSAPTDKPTSKAMGFTLDEWENTLRPEYAAKEKARAVKEAAQRSLPPTRYGDCDANVPSNGALRNEAFTSLW